MVVRGLRGLKNCGNTCYMNSIIQCLSNTVTLREYFLEGEKYGRNWEEELEKGKRKSEKGKEVVRKFCKLLKEIWEGDYTKKEQIDKDVREFYKIYLEYNGDFVRGKQQDVQDFLYSLLECMNINLNISDGSTAGEDKKVDDEVDSYGKSVVMLSSMKWVKYLERYMSIITDIFSGQECSILTCKKESESESESEEYKRYKFDIQNMYAMELNSNKSLEDCIREYTKEEEFDKENYYKDEVDGKIRGKCIKKSIKIYSCGAVLIILLKRFDYRMVKIEDKIEYPLRGLEIDCENGNKSKFDLYGVCNHFGSYNGGHYTAYCLNSEDNKWYEFDDDRVKEIEEGSICSENGYLLFYKNNDI